MTSASRNVPLEVHARRDQPLGMSPAHFLRDYWQKRPLLIREAFVGFTTPLEPEDLAGLACEEFSQARLVQHEPAQDRWSVRDGPFTEVDFAALPAADWTLLVQDVDKWDADVAALLEHFTFLPSWRIDDVMVSYAEDGGSVGAHVDQYDVFLVQGAGQRRWEISTDPSAPLAFRDDTELKLLREFDPTHTWLLEPGDVLYLPPGIPHHGVAIGACMTFSIGMRAPSQAELATDLADFLAARWSDENRYSDADLRPARNAGEIDAATLERLRRVLPLGATLDDPTLCDWFGCFLTRYRSAYLAAPRKRALGLAQFERQLARGMCCLRNPLSRFAWAKAPRATHLYVAGEIHACSASLAIALCTAGARGMRLDDSFSSADRAVLLTLVNAGHLVLQPP